MKKIAIISFSWLHTDPRVLRQIYFLKDRFEIVSFGFAPPLAESDRIEFFKISPDRLNMLHKLKMGILNLMGLHERAYWSSLRVKSAIIALNRAKADIILANDLSALPLGVLFAKRWNVRLICDLHEYAPAEFDANPLWKKVISPYNDYLFKRYLKYAHKIMTVCKAIADKYEKAYGIRCEVINNATFYIEQTRHL